MRRIFLTNYNNLSSLYFNLVWNSYEDSISLGNVKDFELKDILSNGENFLFNLRNKNQKKHETCKKCFGEPTKRGVLFRNFYNKLPIKIKNSNFFNYFKS